MQSREGLANSLASQGLYNSGYSDSAQVSQTTAYRERANTNALERVRMLRELETQISVARMEGSANLSELEAQYMQLMQQQWNTDRAFNYQVSQDAVKNAQWEKEFAAAQKAVEFEKEMRLQEAASAEEQRAIENAYTAGFAGDLSQLKALGMDTSRLEKMLELEAQQLYQSVYGNGGSTGGGYTGGSGYTGGGYTGDDNPGELDAVQRRELEVEAESLIRAFHKGGTEQSLMEYLSGDNVEKMYTGKYGSAGYAYLQELVASGYSAYQPPQPIYTLDYDTAKADVNRMLRRLDKLCDTNASASEIAEQRKRIAETIAGYDISNDDKAELVTYADVVNEWNEMAK